MFSTNLDCGNTSNGVACYSSHATPLNVQCQIKALPEYAPRLTLVITPEAKA